jgi:hypothetical protein
MNSLKRAKTFIGKQVILHMGGHPRSFKHLREKYGKEFPETWGHLGDKAIIVATRKKPHACVFDLQFENEIVTDILDCFINLA